ncbi:MULTISPECIES: CRISPR-associated endonuclease Cas3'' [unclassified Modicisalibacter]|uniref:CRISPR-associated endonuclease Cas3'' n=1 Tax=unclassified Modicisalibacter TaxID=2679913 RepID=UPI001CCC8320|nr:MULTISPECIES: CRISPR-associated endonuclease Cas3'' [unclassified Modicisalibacter]MBZ9558377.1 CRISPR-associated endonuclease Cas3'' [Modicisalibacter sp. R2A 31.J]MBZ9575731.1 CRISPR-associated endonuclease Cas3'' [Modicisalibacter sp. MOD 31.J]
MYYAHSLAGVPREAWQSLESHLVAVGELAAGRAERFGMAEAARVAGLLHDLGKYSHEFQQRLAGSPRRVDHSTAGAVIARDRLGPLGTMLAYAIAGHHAGLANGRDPGERTPLQNRFEAVLPALDSCWEEELSLPGQLIPPAHFTPRRDRGFFQYAFLTRMLFSCLVDADFIDTETFYVRHEHGGSHARGGGPSLVDLRKALDRHLATFEADSDVNRLRAEILSHVRGQSDHPPGRFTLTVPTGGGKTLASLAFALDHAIAHGMDRVIYVIPFTSIVEQNAAVFRQALGEYGATAVLEHHSAFDAGAQRDRLDVDSRDKLRRDSENWDVPIVVTTAVQFFESLFAAKTSRCRKLHNIARSVVILDEAQTMPLPLLRPSVAALDELALNYHTSVVLCTATQPALAETDDPARSFIGGLRDVRELAPCPKRLYRQLERIKVRYIGTLEDNDLREEMLALEQVLCIVNNRRHARALFEAIADQPGTYHLTTSMCAVHRRQMLAEIRQQLKDGRPCRVVSTSLIEAGVDVDFPRVLRAEAGLDSIAQAAGRCNREGKRNVADSEVRIFATANEDWAPPPELEQFAQVSREVLRNHGDDPLSLEAIDAYFRLLYWQQGNKALDRHDLLGLCEKGRLEGLPFETLEQKFRMIENTQLAVIIPFDEPACDAIRRLSHAESVGGIARELQRYTVQVPPQGFAALERAGAIAAIEQERFGEQFMVLINEDLYDDRLGLDWNEPTFRDSESNIW